jgi:hypothetical protein
VPWCCHRPHPPPTPAPPPAGFFPGDPAQGIVSLGGYVTFWGWFFAVVTLLLALLKTEGPEGAAGGSGAPSAPAPGTTANGAISNGEADRLLGSDSEAERGGGGVARRGGEGVGAALGVETRAGGSGSRDGSLGGQWREVVEAYKQLWGVVQLPAIWALSALLVTYRWGQCVVVGGGGDREWRFVLLCEAGWEGGMRRAGAFCRATACKSSLRHDHRPAPAHHPLFPAGTAGWA